MNQNKNNLLKISKQCRNCTNNLNWKNALLFIGIESDELIWMCKPCKNSYLEYVDEDTEIKRELL